MSKAKILSINRNERRVDYKFKRDINFIELYLFLLDFLKIDVYDDFYCYRNEDDELMKKKMFVEKKETLDWYKEEFNFEVFFGTKKVCVVFESDEDLQQKFIDKVSENSKFLKYQEKKDHHEVDINLSNQKMEMK